jgi:flagellar biosynthesis activator protein FlaF
MSISAYQQTIVECDDPRSIEYRVFLRITLDLEAQRNGDWRSAALKDALWRNRELWNTLRADLLDDDNQLVPELRASLISLSFSVMRHTPRILTGEGDVGLLIDINRAIMRGLHPETAEEMVRVA